ncbi:MAG: preprotein translocase subunit SecY [Hydrotalea sp.]|nr:preprotein translocase subunit SecY [Hydrotalea sp.]
MTSAQQFAKNFANGGGGFAKATELKQRILFTLGALLVYRLGSHIPLPGIDAGALERLFNQQGKGILGMFDVFSGGSLSRMTIFALSIMPYISASIIMQLLSATIPSLEKLKKEGGAGYQRILQYTRQLTVVLALFQAYGVSLGLSSADGIVVNPGILFMVTSVITLTSGTMFLMWLSEQITQRGVGQGASVLIFAGILANLPLAIVQVLELGRSGALSVFLIVAVFLLMIVMIAFIVFMERAQRRVVVNYPKRQVGLNRMAGGEASHIPIKINVSGVIPPIFASALLLLPTTILGFLGQAGNDAAWLQWLNTFLGRGALGHNIFYAALIIFFAFFYTAVVFNANETADNLRKQGGIVLGHRPGEDTAKYFDYILSRLTVVGALYLVVVCLLPEILISKYSLPFYLGGTSILIVVSVTMDTITQVQGHLFAHQYENLLKKARMSGNNFGNINLPR